MTQTAKFLYFWRPFDIRNVTYVAQKVEFNITLTNIHFQIDFIK